MSASILLFYSTRCPHSRHFIEESQKYGVSSFHKICIDNTPRERIPISVQSVPALVFAGSNQCLQSEQAFQWLRQQVQENQRRKQQQQQQASLVGNNGQSQQASNGGEPLAWQSTEMGASFSDTYSFLDNSFTESGTGRQPKENNGGSGSTIPKNFAFLGNDTSVQLSADQSPHVQQQQGHYQQGHAPTNMQGMKNNHQQTMRGGAPSGFGTMPPTASMAPPSSRPETDELSKRMESFRMSRDEDVPHAMQRIS